jgi:hypothetical protein
MHFGVFSSVKQEGKFGAVHTVKAYRGVEVQLLSFFAFAADGLSGHPHVPAVYHCRRSPHYPLNVRLGGPKGWSGCRPCWSYDSYIV